MQDAKEEIRARLNIEDVISEYVQLKRAGRNFKGLSPFTGEKTPSFFVSPEKNIWHDFSSNKGGDVFSFVMEVEGVDFRGALELLARRANVELSDFENKGAKERARQKKRILLAHELAVNYYQQSLIKNNHALEYVFKKRGLSKHVVETYGIGYSPDSGDAVVRFLVKKGFSKQELAMAGLTNRFGGDLFRGRMMVPLMDGGGQVIGFTARLINDEPNSPKYLNTPQTLLYDKSRHVFGLSQAKEAIRKADYTVMVEGNLDVVSSYQAGVKQVVATAGTAMTEHHLKALVRLSPNIKLAFDGDSAGLAATERAIAIAQNVGIELTIVSLPDDAKDPDELIKRDPKLWVEAIETDRPAVDWVIDQYHQRENLGSAAGKRQFTTASLKLIQSLNDPVEQEHYLKIIADLASTSLQSLTEKLSSSNVESKKPLKKITHVTDTELDSLAYQDNLLAVALIDPEVRSLMVDIDEDTLVGDERKSVLVYLKKTDKPVIDTPSDLQKNDTYVKILLLKADARYSGWSERDRSLEAARLVRQLITEHKKQKKEQLITELRQAEDTGDDDRAAALRHQLNQLIKEISRA